ncbi:hypothetical protein RXV95_09450 [Novosphingobium sp. ZN18A2]|uniref:hypothetical protein n=1 Tax=Novosphingobium sp. ZN18A2 TaxID=3079861 RepID=UPI0030D4D7D0
MSERKDAEALAEARELRAEAWRLVRGDIDEVREGLNGRVLANRVKDRATEEVADAIEQARDIASSHKSVVAGTILALLGWLFRDPVFGLFRAIGDRSTDPSEGDSDAGGNVTGDGN